MKYLFSILIIFPLMVFSQNKDTIKVHKVPIGFTFSPGYCFRTLKATDSLSRWIVGHRDSVEIPKFGYSVGVNWDYKQNKNFTLALGVAFSDRGAKTIKQTTTWIATQPNDPTLPKHYTFIYHLYYLDIPLKAKYFLVKRRAKIFIAAGISPSISLIQGTTTLGEYADGHTSKNTTFGFDGFRIINLTAIGGLGFRYDINKKIFLTFEPTFLYSVIPIVHSPVKEHLYSAGLSIGISLKR